MKCAYVHVQQYLVLSGGSAQLKTNSIFSLKLYLLPFSSLKLELTTMVKSIPKPWASWSKMTLFPLWSSLWPASFFFCLSADSPFSVTSNMNNLYFCCAPHAAFPVISCWNVNAYCCLARTASLCHLLLHFNVSVLSFYAMLLLPFGNKLFVNSPKGKQSLTAVFLYIDSVQS